MKKYGLMLSMALMVWGSVTIYATAQELKAVTQDFKPYSYEQNGKVTGIATEIVELILERANLQASFTVYPWARAYKIATEEPNVMIYSLVRSAERENLFKWIGPILPPVKTYLYKLKKRTDIHLTSLDDARQYSIGVVRATMPHQFLMKQGFEEEKNLSINANQDALIKNFFTERIDLIMSESLNFAAQASGIGFTPGDAEPAIELSILTVEFYLGISLKTDDALVQKIQAAFDQVKTEGKIEAIIEKYTKMYK